MRIPEPCFPFTNRAGPGNEQFVDAVADAVLIHLAFGD